MTLSGCLFLTLVPSGSNWLSLAFTGSLPVSLWLCVALCYSHSGSLWLSLTLSLSLSDSHSSSLWP